MRFPKTLTKTTPFLLCLQLSLEELICLFFCNALSLINSLAHFLTYKDCSSIPSAVYSFTSPKRISLACLHKIGIPILSPWPDMPLTYTGPEQECEWRPTCMSKYLKGPTGLHAHTCECVGSMWAWPFGPQTSNRLGRGMAGGKQEPYKVGAQVLSCLSPRMVLPYFPYSA